MKLVYLIIGLFVMLLIIMGLGIAGFIFHTITDNLMIDINIGDVNLLNATNQTLGEIDRGFSNNLDYLGIAVILSTVIFMALNGYFIGRSYHRLFIIVDIFILIIAFIIAVYISQMYNTLIYVTSTLDIYINEMPKSSTFLVNLPWFVSIIGVITMIISYIAIPKQENEEVINPQVYGY